MISDSNQLYMAFLLYSLAHDPPSTWPLFIKLTKFWNMTFTAPHLHGRQIFPDDKKPNTIHCWDNISSVERLLTTSLALLWLAMPLFSSISWHISIGYLLLELQACWDPCLSSIGLIFHFGYPGEEFNWIIEFQNHFQNYFQNHIWPGAIQLNYWNSFWKSYWDGYCWKAMCQLPSLL